MNDDHFADVSSHPFRATTFIDRVHRVHWAFRVFTTSSLIGLAALFMVVRSQGQAIAELQADVTRIISHQISIEADGSTLHGSPVPTMPGGDWVLYASKSESKLYLRGPHGHEFVFNDPPNPVLGGTFEVRGGAALNALTGGGGAGGTITLQAGSYDPNVDASNTLYFPAPTP